MLAAVAARDAAWFICIVAALAEKPQSMIELQRAAQVTPRWTWHFKRLVFKLVDKGVVVSVPMPGRSWCTYYLASAMPKPSAAELLARPTR